jgi:dGTPase
MIRKRTDPELDAWPMTLEGCVVRMADTISYIGRDIEDAIRLGLIKRSDIPEPCSRILGDTNGTIVYRLVEDLVANSLEKPSVSFTAEVSDALKRLKEFNHERIYQSGKVKEQTHKVMLMFGLLFERYLEDLRTGNPRSDIFVEFLDGMAPGYVEMTAPAGIVRDFIAGMTDAYFMEQCRKNFIPQVRSSRF